MRPSDECPNCGVPPTAEYVTITRSRASTNALLLVGILLFVIAATERPFADWQPLELLALSACVLATWFVVRPQPCKIVLWDGGFTIIGRQPTPESFYWSDVSTVRWDQDNASIECTNADNQLVATLDTSVFGTRAKAERFRQQATAHLTGTTDKSAGQNQQ